MGRMKEQIIDTPYGRKTPEVLCSAMDAHSLLPDVLHVLYTALPFIEDAAGDHCYKEGVAKQVESKIRAAIANIERISP